MAFEHPLKKAAQARFKAEAATRAGRLVPCNAKGILLGEHHHRARLSDAQVEALRTGYEAEVAAQATTGKPLVLKPWLAAQAKALDVSVRTVKALIYHQRRNAWAEGWKRIDN